MQKGILIDIINKYLKKFPEEKQRQIKLIEYLENNEDAQIVDWNNFNGHIVAGAFIYAKAEKRFLVLYHNDLKRYLYPGGHADINDLSPLETAIREVKEETGLNNFIQFNINRNSLIPIDIDTHIVEYNKRLKLPQHYHFDFRYIFITDKISDVNIDTEELSSYKWVSIEELSKNASYDRIIKKIEKLLSLPF